jgi:hypothetical protein
MVKKNTTKQATKQQAGNKTTNKKTKTVRAHNHKDNHTKHGKTQTW